MARVNIDDADNRKPGGKDTTIIDGARRYTWKELTGPLSQRFDFFFVFEDS